METCLRCLRSDRGRQIADDIGQGFSSSFLRAQAREERKRGLSAWTGCLSGHFSSAPLSGREKLEWGESPRPAAERGSAN